MQNCHLRFFGLSINLVLCTLPGDTTGTPEALVAIGAADELVEIGVEDTTGIVGVPPAIAGLRGGTDVGVGAKLIPAIPVSNPVGADDVFGVEVKDTYTDKKL